MDKRFLFIGGDKRIIYAADVISRRYGTAFIGLTEDFPAPSGEYGCIVLPLPFSRDGVNINAPLSQQTIPLAELTRYAAAGACVFSGGTSPLLSEICAGAGLELTDYFAGEELTLKNALLTAEGAVSILISETDFSLHGARAVITGYGRIARYLVRLMGVFGCSVSVCARDPIQRVRAGLDGCTAADISQLHTLCKNADIIINTAPAQLFTEEDFAAVRAGSVYMELASKSAEPERSYAAAHGVKHIMAAGLPGKLSPKTAGEAIAQGILGCFVAPKT